MYDILKGANPQIKVKQYADDIAVFYREFNTEFAKKEIEKGVSQWVSEKFKQQRTIYIEPKKSQFIVFERKKRGRERKEDKNRNRTGTIKINGIEIKEEETILFLGVVFDKKT